VGPATRINLDEYIHTTEAGLRRYTGIENCKTMLNVNPAEPSITMQVTVFASVENPDLRHLDRVLRKMVAKVARYTPGYQVVVGPLVEADRLAVTIRVTGAGDYLPPYAGNLDIINCAAIATAERFAVAGAADQDVAATVEAEF
jgi:acetaldehyde dehydrogenase (acetylating)